MDTTRKARIGLIFSVMNPSEPTWPHVGYDYDSKVKEISSKVKEAFPDVEFLEAVISAGCGEPAVFPDREGSLPVVGLSGERGPNADLIPDDVESYVVFLIGIWNGVPGDVVRRGKPTVLVDDLFGGTGEFLSTLSWAREKGYPTIGVASSSFDDVLRAISLLKAVHSLRSSVILDIRDGETWSERRGIPNALRELGVQVKFMSSEQVKKIYDEVKDEEAMPYYQKWLDGALGIKEPPKSEVMKAAKLHVALLKAMKETGADSVTVDCLSLVLGKKLPAYPFLSFAELDNEGSVGTCEADLDSAFTQLAVRYTTDRPSFVSDPVIDTAKGEIIYAHCTAPWKMFGSRGPTNPYVLRTHAEDRSGVSVQSLLPTGEIVTTVKFDVVKKAMVVHSGIATENLETENGCRTKLGTKTNVNAILANWNAGGKFGWWHRVTVYGDLRDDFKKLAVLLGMTAFEEDKGRL